MYRFLSVLFPLFYSLGFFDKICLKHTDYKVCSWDKKHKAKYGLLLANHSHIHPVPNQLRPANLHHEPSNQESGKLPHKSSKLHDSANLTLVIKEKRETRKTATHTKKFRSGKQMWFHSGWRRDFIISNLCNDMKVTRVLTNSSSRCFILFFCIVYRSSYSGAKPFCFHSITGYWNETISDNLHLVQIKHSVTSGIDSPTSSYTWFSSLSQASNQTKLQMSPQHPPL